MSLFLIPLLIAFTDVLWAPTVLERYHMDVYWLLCLLCFLVTGLYYQNLAIPSEAIPKNGRTRMGKLSRIPSKVTKGNWSDIGVSYGRLLAPLSAVLSCDRALLPESRHKNSKKIQLHFIRLGVPYHLRKRKYN